MPLAECQAKAATKWMFFAAQYECTCNFSPTTQTIVKGENKKSAKKDEKKKRSKIARGRGQNNRIESPQPCRETSGATESIDTNTILADSQSPERHSKALSIRAQAEITVPLSQPPSFRKCTQKPTLCQAFSMRGKVKNRM